MSKGMLIIISGPAGSGKGTVVKQLLPNNDFALSISVTTRAKRGAEQDGVDYFFCTTDEFDRMKKNEELLEHAMFVGNYYGTPKQYVLDKINEGKTVVLEIEVNGALQIKEKFNDCVLVFLIPPSMSELKKRLIGRATEDIETIEYRLRRAREEIKLISKYDYLIINSEVEKAVSDIERIVTTEKMKPHRLESKITAFMED